jgi:hypothetical protein
MQLTKRNKLELEQRTEMRIGQEISNDRNIKEKGGIEEKY